MGTPKVISIQLKDTVHLNIIKMKSFIILAAAANAQENSCVKPDASTFPGGMIRCDEEVVHKSTCIFICFGGKVVQGSSSLARDNGSFVDQIPACIDPADIVCDDCCDWSFRDVDNALVTCTNDNKKKSECSVVCDDGFELDGDDQAKCTKGGWNKAVPTCVEEVFTTLEPPTTLSDDHVESWFTENFGFQIIESDPNAALHKVAWNEGLFVDANNEVQFGGEVNFTPTDNSYTLTVPDYLQIYKLELMVKFWSGHVFADTKYTEAGQEPTTTAGITTFTTITTTEEPTEAPTTQELTTMIYDNFGNINLRAEEVTATSTMLRWNGQQGNGKLVSRQWIRFTDEFGAKTMIEVGVNANQYKLDGLIPGYTYEFEIVKQFNTGRKERGVNSAKMTSNGGADGGSGEAKCVVCHSDESNDECNKRALSCDAAQNQMCQTVVRVENGQAPRYEKRCKQKQACKNERAIYAQTGICQGGTRTQNVDVCVYCCEGDYCNVNGPWMDSLVEV